MAQSINIVRITVRQQPADNVIFQDEFAVNPESADWELPADVPPNIEITILVELIHEDPSGARTIEFSGIIGPIRVTAGPQPQTPEVPVYPGGPENLSITSVTLAPRTLQLFESTQGVVSAVVAPNGGRVFYESRSPAIATIDESGLVSALTPGTARIVAQAGPRKDSINVVVSARAVRATITPDPGNLASLNTNITFTAKAFDARNVEVTGLTFNWTIDDGNIATMVSPGVFRSLHVGETTVHATTSQGFGTIAASATLRVSQTGSTLTVNPAAHTFNALGQAHDFTFELKDAAGNRIEAAGTWSSSRPEVARVDEHGRVTAVSNGTARVEVSVGGLTAGADITVQQTPAGFNVTPEENTLTSEGAQVTLVAAIRDANNNPMPTPAVTWSTSNPAVATVDHTGVVTAHENGTAWIYAVSGTLRDSARITVQRTAHSVQIRRFVEELAVGSSFDFDAVAIDLAGIIIVGHPIAWSSSNPAAATVDAVTGEVTGVAEGTTVITAEADGNSAEVTVHVTGGGPGAISGRVVDPNGNGIAGATVTFFAQHESQQSRFSSVMPDSPSDAPQVTTDDQGRFTSPALAPGAYDVKAEKSGWTTTIYRGAVVVMQETLQLEPLVLVPFSEFPGGISGTVRNARNVQSIAGAVVELRVGQNNISGEPFATTTANGSGFYSFASLPAQVYTVLARADGFTEGYRTGIVVGETTRSGQDVLLTPLGNPSEIYIVLTWGSSPSDLDSHLSGPLSSGGRFHVWYGGTGVLTSAPFAQLDVDDTSAFGPETITISQTFAGLYRYSVHNFSNRSSTGSTVLANSGAKVRVYQGATLLAEFNVPNQVGTLWTVFEMNGGVISPVQTVTEYFGGTDAIPVRAPGDSRNDQELIEAATATHPKRDRQLRD